MTRKPGPPRAGAFDDPSQDPPAAKDDAGFPPEDPKAAKAARLSAHGLAREAARAMRRALMDCYNG